MIGCQSKTIQRRSFHCSLCYMCSVCFFVCWFAGDLFFSPHFPLLVDLLEMETAQNLRRKLEAVLVKRPDLQPLLHEIRVELDRGEPKKNDAIQSIIQALKSPQLQPQSLLINPIYPSYISPI